MDSFDLAFAFMAPHEWNARRNYTNLTDDPGGPTKFGITLSAWRQLGSHADLDHDGDVDADDVKLLGRGEAEAFYRSRYWVWGGVADACVAAKLFDMGVNLGVGTAVRYLQQAVGAVADGKLGPKTLAAANAASRDALLNALCAKQLDHYARWISANPRREIFRAGLMKRATALPCGR